MFRRDFQRNNEPTFYEGCKPIFIDAEYDTWNMDPVALEKGFQLHPEAKAVIIVNLYGTPCKMDEIKGICDRHGAVLIEDAAESLGAAYKDRQTGTFGRDSAISFNGNKIITALQAACFSQMMCLPQIRPASGLHKAERTPPDISMRRSAITIG